MKKTICTMLLIIATVTFSQQSNLSPVLTKQGYLHFNKDGSGEINEGLSKCNSADPQSLFIQWSFINNAETKIKINGGDYFIERLEYNNFQIHSLSTDPHASQVAKTYSK